MSPLYSFGYIILIICIIFVILGAHYAVNNDSVDRDNKTTKRLIYIISGIVCVLLLVGYLIIFTKN